MAIQADLGPPVLPPLPLQPPLKPPSLAVHDNYSFGHNSYQNSTITRYQNSRDNIIINRRTTVVITIANMFISNGTRLSTAHIPPSFHTAVHHSNIYDTDQYHNTQDERTTTAHTSLDHPNENLAASEAAAAAVASSCCRSPTPPGAVAQPQQRRAQPATRTPRPPPPAHRRIRYNQHHTSRVSARSELTSLTSGPLNNSLLQMMSETLMLTWPQKCVLAMSKERYLASSPSVAHQVFRSYYEDRDEADDWRGADGNDGEDEEAGAVIASGLPSPPPEQDDFQFDFRYQNDDGDEMAMTSPFSAAAAAAYRHQYYHEHQQDHETAARNPDAGEVSSLSSEERSPNMMDLPPTRNNHVTTGEVSSVSSSSDNPSPKPLALPARTTTTTTTTTMPTTPNRQHQHHQRKPTLISHLTVGAAVFRIDVRSQRPTILLLKKRAPLPATTNTGGPASGPPSPYQQHHPPHHYNRPFLEQLPRHLLPPHPSDHNDDSGSRRSGTNQSSLGQQQPPPPVWELPSGRVEDGDYCISDAIARCVKRLTSLNVVRISSMLRETTSSTDPPTTAGNNNGSRQQNVNYDPLRALPHGAAFTSAGGSLAGGSVRFLDEEGWPDLTSPQQKEKMQLQLNWTVLVANVEDVVLKGVEHEEFVWANWNVLDMLNLTSATREVAKEALEWAGRCSF
ncbi:hypothetical protein PG995_012864 [Apiospora arundinis]